MTSWRESKHSPRKSLAPALIVFVGSKQLTLIMNILIRCILPIFTDKMSEKQNLIIHDDAVEVEKDMRRMQDGAECVGGAMTFFCRILSVPY